LKQLNLPQYSFRVTGREGSEMIFDAIRKKWVRLTPEEWVRQNFVRYLIEEGGYPPGLIGIEVMFRLNNLRKRADILVHNRRGEPVMIVECKAPDVPVAENEKVREQIGVYNMEFRVPYVMITNGITHYSFRYDADSNKYEYMLVIPLYIDLLQE
jgi:hypothetical protein